LCCFVLTNVRFDYFVSNVIQKLRQELEKTKTALSKVYEENYLLKAKTKENITDFEKDVQNKLSKFFTKTQIRYFLQPQTRIHKWENEDIIGAITLRSILPKAYNYLRLTLGYPYPGWYDFKFKEVFVSTMI